MAKEEAAIAPLSLPVRAAMVENIERLSDAFPRHGIARNPADQSAHRDVSSAAAASEKERHSCCHEQATRARRVVLSRFA
jgi:hypothetical protein